MGLTDVDMAVVETAAEAALVLDGAVAKLVFGWWIEERGYWAEARRWMGFDEAGLRGVAAYTLAGCPLGENSFRLNGLPYFSYDTAAAWKVVEKLREIGFGIMINDGEGDLWEVEVATTMGMDKKGYRGAFVEDDRVARAICRAAVKAVQGD